jgi:hypothetical protein
LSVLNNEQFAEVRPIVMTTYERGKRDGQLAGQLAERGETALLQLEAKFGTLSAEVKQRVESLSGADLRRLTLDLIKAESLKELHLED